MVISDFGPRYPNRLEKLFSIIYYSLLMFIEGPSIWLLQSNLDFKLSHASSTRRLVRCSPYNLFLFFFEDVGGFAGGSLIHAHLSDQQCSEVHHAQDQKYLFI